MKLTQKTPAWLIASEVKLIYKTKVKACDRPTVITSESAYKVLLQAWDKGTIDLMEKFNVVLINRANQVIGIYNVSSGGITGTIADVRLVFIAALKASAVSIIIAHNHPSGNLLPSKRDEDVTSKIKQAGQLLDIKLLDHIIITSNGYFSFADEGKL